MPQHQLCPAGAKILRPTTLPLTQPRFRLSQAKRLHAEQERAVNEIMERFQAEQKVTLHGSTGSGKTWVASNVIFRMQPKAVLVLVPVKALAMQLQRAFAADFVDTISQVFISQISGYSAPEVIETNGIIEVKKGRRIIDEDAKQIRIDTVAAVNGGDPCIVTSSTSSLFYCPSLLADDEGDGDLTKEEIVRIVDELQREVHDLADYDITVRTRGRTEALRRRIEADITSLKTKGTCPNLFEFYDDLLPKRMKRTFIDKMNECYGRDWLMIVDECHSTVPAMKGPHAAHRTRVIKQVAEGRMRRTLLQTDRHTGPLSWADIQNRLPSSVLFMSATPPSQEDLGHMVSLEMRPTHICDPVITKIVTKWNPSAEQRRSQHDLWNLLGSVRTILMDRRPEDQAIVATVECNQADILHSFISVDHRCGVVHGEKTREEKTEILKQFRNGQLDVLCGSKMVIEGLDLPGVALVVVPDANFSGFLRTEAVLTQLVGRTARHASGRAFFLVTEDGRPTDAVDNCIKQHRERRIRQENYNRKHGVTAESIEWEPRLRRMPKDEKADPDALCSPSSGASKPEDVQKYSSEQIFTILSSLVKTCWAEKPEGVEDWSEEDPEKSHQNWTTPALHEGRFEMFYFKENEVEKMLPQLILMVTVPAIGPVRSYHLLQRNGDIDQILRQTLAELRKVTQIRGVLSERLLLPRTSELLANNRRKLAQILQLKEFTSQVAELFEGMERKDLKMQAKKAIEDETGGFVLELVCRLIDLCCIQHETDKIC